MQHRIYVCEEHAIVRNLTEINWKKKKEGTAECKKRVEKEGKEGQDSGKESACGRAHVPDASACVAVMLPPDDPENEPIFELSGSFVPTPPPLCMLFADDRAGGNGGAAALPADTLPLRGPVLANMSSLAVFVLAALPARALYW